MTRLWHFIGCFPAALVLAACSSEPTEDGNAGSSSGGGSAGAGGKGSGAMPARCPGGPDAATDTEPVMVGLVSAQLVDEQGEPTSAGLVQVCGKDICYDVPVDATGQLVKDVSGEMNAPACKFGDGKAFGKLAIPLAAGDTDLGTLTVVALPDFADGVALAPGESATSGGVTLTLSEDALVEIDTLSYEEEAEWGFRAAAVSGVALTQLGQDFALAFALAPLETRICPSPALSVANDAQLAAGTELELFSLGLEVSEEWAPYAGWQKVGDGLVSEDGSTLDFPEGVPLLTAIGIREKL